MSLPDAATVPPPAPVPPRPPVDRATLRLALVVGGLVIALIAGFGLGRVVDPAPASAPPAGGDQAADHTHPPGTAPHEHGAGAGAAGRTGADPVGLSLSAAGYTLAPTATQLAAGARQDFRFRIVGPDAKPVTTFAIVHDKPLHLIVARRDLSGYQHLHPTMAPDGTWSVPLTLPQPGVWRAYADFTVNDATGGQTELTLGVDLAAAGTYAPRPLPAPAREAAVDGFTVGYEGTPRVGAVAPLLFRVFRDGAPAAGLERYLGAYGHLVVIREGDLGYVHVHPEAQLSDGAVKFWLALPGPGRYRMFFDFQVAGEVRTAEFTAVVP
ncbi:hypothetical protein SAMN05444365_103492 [Micromonospora pattaloongensis]|uniref:Secreted protein n=1 Tax=Micromonospora pattaloongensis TaxID=405436 RepID=A0A1H3MRV8_9ACTN|nr:hypothetical protein [Micromonospora pattaloongensis]SDY79220.1 hypothetical protein SAMN05444365_103492 [Micromonospora pattaloongensis]